MTTTLNILRREVALSRQADMVPRDKVEELAVAIIGCGGIGSNVAYALASTGFRSFLLYDPDNVALENIYPGWFALEDIGTNKAEAVKARLVEWLGLDPVLITDYPYTFEQTPVSALRPDIYIVGTDTLASRQQIWQALRESGDAEGALIVDARMGGTAYEIHLVNGDEYHVTEYNKSLEGQEGQLPCGMKATAAVTKGLLPGLITRLLRVYVLGQPLPYSIYGDLEDDDIDTIAPYT